MTLPVAIATDANKTHVAENTIAADSFPETITETNSTIAVKTLPKVITETVRRNPHSNYAVRVNAMPLVTAAIGGVLMLV